MKVYHYNYLTKEYLGAVDANIDPEETFLAKQKNVDAHPIYLIPAFSTVMRPPEFGNKQKPVFLNDEWVLVEDHRGEKWCDSNGVEVIIEKLGNPADIGLYKSPVKE